MDEMEQRREHALHTKDYKGMVERYFKTVAMPDKERIVMGALIQAWRMIDILNAQLTKPQIAAHRHYTKDGDSGDVTGPAGPWPADG